MKYTMRRYFSATHAWVVKGFEEHSDGMNASNSQVDILQSKVPGFVRSALEQRFQHQGFTLDDMVSMVAVVESLAFNEVVRGVELSFALNYFAPGAILSEVQLQEVLDSYLITEMLEGTTDAAQHAADKSNILERYPNWYNAVTFLADISGSDGFGRQSIKNPFTEKTFVFEDAVRMAGRISEEFGPWSSYECHDMKNILSERDPHETGRVKLSDFYRASQDGAWQFLEPSEYLRQLGALDESSEYLGPQVIIPNYITGMSNCITSAPYFSICCLNECDLISEHIEGAILRERLQNPSSPIGQCVVVGYPDKIQGEVPLAFLVPTEKGKTIKQDDTMRCFQLVRKIVGDVNVKFVQVSGLPMTFSGKFMRRLLKCMAKGEALGDTSTIVNGEILPVIEKEFKAWQEEDKKLFGY